MALSNDTPAPTKPLRADYQQGSCSPSSRDDDMASAIGGFIDDLKRERDEWKDSCARYHAANADLLKERNDMLDLLRRIARKGEFMDREGLRLVVSDWIARRGLSLENA